MAKRNPLYVSTDVEADGPAPILNSMLSLGSAVFTPEGRLIDRFYRKLKPLPGATQNPATMEFWRQNPEAWEEVTTGAEDPEQVMKDYDKWLEALPGRPHFVAWPLGFDWCYVYMYLMKFVGRSLFGWSGIDAKSYIAGALDKEMYRMSKKAIPFHLRSNRPHTHIAIDDAIEQGETFMNVLRSKAKDAV